MLRLILQDDGIKNVDRRWQEMKNITSVVYYNSFWKDYYRVNVGLFTDFFHWNILWNNT